MEQALTLLFTLIGQAQRVSAVIETARAEGREITDDEFDQLFADLELSRSDALAAIQEARQT